MNLTPEQQAVVDISNGRHLVLAPPGSGKTEMLTQRVIAALKRGVPPGKMFCVTFTVRAGIEMRERVAAAAMSDSALKGKSLPDIGNIHHFCNRMLCENGLIPDSKKVVDEIAQRELIKDVWIQLKKELRERVKKPQEMIDPESRQMLLPLFQEEKEVEEAVCVLDSFEPNKPAGMIDRDYYSELLAQMEACANEYAYSRQSIYPDLVTAAARYHRQRCGIPYSLLRPIPSRLYPLMKNGLLRAIAQAYVKLKNRFGALDFDDLITESYLALKGERVMREEARFTWIQVDEVQDLNAMQWEIVKMVSRLNATSVFFGDAEQTIFSFMGASAERLARVASTCSVHYFRKNFRATPYLLDILVRYSLKVLRSKWLFLPQPSDRAPLTGELYCGEGGLAAAANIALGWIKNSKTPDVAILVRRNRDADELEQIIKSIGDDIRYVKVSGVEIFELPAMRDFIAFCTLLNEDGSLLSWARMFRRFSGVRQDHISRRLVKSLVDMGLTPRKFLESSEDRPSFTPWMRDRLTGIRKRLVGLWKVSGAILDKPSTYKDLFDRFDDVCWQGKLFSVLDYVTPDEAQEYERTHKNAAMPLEVARRRFLLRTGKLFRYFEKKRAQAIAANPDYGKTPLRGVMKAEWREVLQLREADLIVGDEQIVISTIHKAKGRQFGGVVIPCCDDKTYPSWFSQTPEAQDEDARVLYVGLSRAKRHLALCYEGNPSPFIACIRPCFAQGFVDYFRRLLGLAPSGQAQNRDWLVEYNELLEAGFAHHCPVDKVRSLVDSESVGNPDLILRRIAVSTLVYAVDERWRDECYLHVIKQSARNSEESDVLKEAIRGVGSLRLTKFVADNSLRTAFLKACYSPMKDGLHLAILECYASLLDRHELTLDDVFNDNDSVEVSDELRAKLRSGVEDALFSDNGDVRLEAYRQLVDNFDPKLEVALDGSDADWRKLHVFMSESRKKVLMWMLQNNWTALPKGVWRDHIVELLKAYDAEKGSS